DLGAGDAGRAAERSVGAAGHARSGPAAAQDLRRPAGEHGGRMSASRKIAALIAAGSMTLLAGCGIGSIFGGEDTPPLPGERLPVLPSDVALEADPRLADVPVVVPPPAVNPEWPQTGGTP